VTGHLVLGEEVADRHAELACDDDQLVSGPAALSAQLLRARRC